MLELETLQSGLLVAVLGTGAGNDWLLVVSPEGQMKFLSQLPMGSVSIWDQVVELLDGSLLLQTGNGSGFQFLATEGSAPPKWFFDLPRECMTLRVAPGGTPLCLRREESGARYSLSAYEDEHWSEVAMVQLRGEEANFPLTPDNTIALDRQSLLLLDTERVRILSAQGVRRLGENGLWIGMVNDRAMVSYCHCEADQSCQSDLVRVDASGEQERLPIPLPSGQLWGVRSSGSNQMVLEMSTPSGRLLLLARERNGSWETETLWAEKRDERDGFEDKHQFPQR